MSACKASRPDLKQLSNPRVQTALSAAQSHANNMTQKNARSVAREPIDDVTFVLKTAVLAQAQLSY